MINMICFHWNKRKKFEIQVVFNGLHCTAACTSNLMPPRSNSETSGLKLESDPIRSNVKWSNFQIRLNTHSLVLTTIFIVLEGIFL